jgi:hypothetical protein
MWVRKVSNHRALDVFSDSGQVVPISYYYKHSPNASCVWGVSVSATWGRGCYCPPTWMFYKPDSNIRDAVVPSDLSSTPRLV